MRAICILVLICVPGLAADATRPLTTAEFRDLAKQCLPDAPLSTLRAIAKVESAYYPLAISINYADKASTALGLEDGSVELSRQPTSLREAVQWAKWFYAHGLTVSVGLMQINTEHLPAMALSLEQAFEPCTNLRAGWTILNAKYRAAAAVVGKGQLALHAAISAYNSGSLTGGFNKGYRFDPNPSGYGYGDDNQERFDTRRGAIQAIVTSTAIRDSGRFEVNLRDERYLPFEGAGVIGGWRLDLPAKDLQSFDYSTIEDVILQVQYTARDGGQRLKEKAEAAVRATLGDTGRTLLISVRHDEPNGWPHLSQGVEFKLRRAWLSYPFNLLEWKCEIKAVTWVQVGTLEQGFKLEVNGNGHEFSENSWTMQDSEIDFTFETPLTLRVTGRAEDLLCLVAYTATK